MKKITGLYKGYMLRPIIYKAATKLSIAIALVLVWNRWINKAYHMSLGDGFFTIGMIAMMMSWFCYLKLDGIKLYLWNEKKEKKKKHKVRDIIDYADEKIISYDELEPDEQEACKLASNLITGVIMLITSFIVMII